MWYGVTCTQVISTGLWNGHHWTCINTIRARKWHKSVHSAVRTFECTATQRNHSDKHATSVKFPKKLTWHFTKDVFERKMHKKTFKQWRKYNWCTPNFCGPMLTELFGGWQFLSWSFQKVQRVWSNHSKWTCSKNWNPKDKIHWNQLSLYSWS